MKFTKTRFFIITAALFTALCFTGCTSDIELELKKNGNVDVSFNGTAGKAFAALINTAVSGDASSPVVFDTKEIEYEMSGNGFSNVKAVSKNGTSLSVTMTDKDGKSALFTSGVISIENNKLNACLSPKELVAFYNSTDSQTTMFLDMLLSPVLNDELMTEEEYLELLASFYGEDIAQEIKEGTFRITLKNPDGTKVIKAIPFVKLLTLNEVIRF